MCGIAGVLGETIAATTLRAMASAIAHRGPDDEGVWADADAGIGFAHRRLAIVDLSPAGAQPMHSANLRFVLAFNGEIYNHEDLRAELEAAHAAPVGGWRGHSDTETLLQAIVVWGMEAALQRAVGMFAIALWDRAERQLSLARDRFGEKPLYYGWAGRSLLFGSELKALKAHPACDPEIDRTALADFIAHGYVSAPRSIYRRIFKLEPATILAIRPGTAPSDEPLVGRRFWNYADVLAAGLADPIGNEEQALAMLDEALGNAIAGQAIADVPVGAFLSGGIDSSTVVAYYQRHSATPVRTYTIGFEEAGFNEAEDARRVAKALGTIHHEHYVGVAEAQAVIPDLPAIYDEPFADSSQIPTHLVSLFARREVTVALSGDGGDELFGGYNRHVQAPALWSRLARVPGPVRALGSAFLSGIPSRWWSAAIGIVPGQHQPHVGAKLQKAIGVAGNARSLDDVYHSFLDEWDGEDSPVLQAGTPRARPTGFGQGAARLMYADAIGYLPDDILHKVDRAAMRCSLETRVPFLDHRIAALAARIPAGMMIRGGQGKQPLRQLLYRQAPRELFDRPKAGFALPIGDWLRGGLKPWAEALLDEGRLRGQALLDPAIVRKRWHDHLSGKRDSAPALWSILMFQAWLDAQRA